MATQSDYPDLPLPSDADAHLARLAAPRLIKLLGAKSPAPLRIESDDQEGGIAIPGIAARLLADILNQMGQGSAMTLIPVHAELTTQQAADMLNVSRPFVIGLLDSNQIPCRKVGTHRRVLFRDVMAYKQRIDNDRLAALAELAKQSQELNLGY